MVRFIMKLAVVVACAVMFAGCSGSIERTVAVYPVDGQLVVGGQAPSGAVVTFHPAVPGESSASLIAVVRADGHFVAKQPDGAVGLPEGNYKLTVTWPEQDKDRFNGKYADPATPIAEITVKPSINLLPPIKLP